MGAVVTFEEFAGILTPANGFIRDAGFAFTCNPYQGCAFGCSYCYAMCFAPTQELRETWGEWVKVKTNAVDRLAREGRKAAGKRVYLGSVTDPYQPVERDTLLTRRLLERMLEIEPQPRLVVQTRSPLVCRDYDLLARFAHARVNLSITTDDDTTRKAFEPLCPSIDQRFQAVNELHSAGVRTGICLSPLLPVTDAASFGARLREAGADRYAIQYLERGRGRFSACTADAAWTLAETYGWDQDAYERTRDLLAGCLPDLREGRAGFRPE